MKFVFAGLLRLVSFEQYDSAAFVTRRKVIAGLIELHGRDDVGFRYVLDVTLVTEASINASVSYPTRVILIVARNGLNAETMSGNRTARVSRVLQEHRVARIAK